MEQPRQDKKPNEPTKEMPAFSLVTFKYEEYSRC